MTFILFLASLFCSIAMFFGDPVVTTALANDTAGATDYVSLNEAVRAAYSREVFFQAQPRLRFLQFAKRKTELQAVKGKSITFTRYTALEGGGALDENELLTSVGINASEVVISVSEQGNAVTVSEMLLKTSFLDVLNDAVQLLATNMAQVLDKQFRDVVLTTTNTVFGAGKTTAASLTTGDGLTTATVKNAVEKLATANAPRYNGDYYVCFAHPHQLRQLRDDSAWINAQAYRGTGRQLYIGEVGMYEGVVFIETTQMPILNNAAVIAKYGAGFNPTSGYEAVFFGENAYGWAIALPVELRDDGVQNLGRMHTLGWYGIWGVGIIEEANIIKCLTA